MSTAVPQWVSSPASFFTRHASNGGGDVCLAREHQTSRPTLRPMRQRAIERERSRSIRLFIGLRRSTVQKHSVLHIRIRELRSNLTPRPGDIDDLGWPTQDRRDTHLLYRFALGE